MVGQEFELKIMGFGVERNRVLKTDSFNLMNWVYCGRKTNHL